MTSISGATLTAIFDSLRAAGASAGKCASLQEAAQAATDVLFEAFESIVLCRVFIVVPYEKLPAADWVFVDKLAIAKGISADIKPGTQVLSLLGTRGVSRDWNNRLDSKGHLGIPLVTAKFIQAIPMLSRMLHELGVDVAVDNPNDKTLVARLLSAGLGGVFHVPDAAVTADRDGEIIPAQDFVSSYNVRAVFGVAGNYMAGLSVAVLLFTKEDLAREDARHFLALVNEFKASTMGLVRSGRLYARR